MKITFTNGLLQILALSATTLCAGATAAQGTTASASENDDWAPVRHLEFKPEDVEGERLDPGGTEIISVPRAEHGSLIEIRAGFEAEIIKTMENM